MRTSETGSSPRRVVLVAAWLLLLAALPAARLAAQPVPPPTAEKQNDDPPRQDLRMGNAENMRMGRDAQGNIIMEIHAPPGSGQTQPPVGPFFIYPQVGVPFGGPAGPGMPMQPYGQGSHGMPTGHFGQQPYGGAPSQGHTGRMPAQSTPPRTSGGATTGGQPGQTTSGQEGSPSGQQPASASGSTP